MQRAFRPSSPADEAAIRALCARVLAVPDGSPVLSPEHMRWKYWDAWPGWSGSRGFVMTKDDEVIAHAAVVPLYVERNGVQHTLLQPIDWAADSRAVGAGVSLLKQLRARCDGLVSIRGSQMTRSLLAPLGYRSLGEVTRYATPLPSVGELVRGCELRIHRHGLERAAPRPQHAAHCDARLVQPGRSLAQLAALLRCPAAAMEYGELWRDGSLLATCLLCRTPSQVRWVDAWGGTSEGFQQLAVQVLSYASDTRGHATELVCQTNDRAQEQALVAAGFRRAGSDPLAILTSADVVAEGATLRHQMIDSDLAYLHHGQPESWLQEAEACPP